MLGGGQTLGGFPTNLCAHGGGADTWGVPHQSVSTGLSRIFATELVLKSKTIDSSPCLEVVVE
jgi:hypothetical protein